MVGFAPEPGPSDDRNSSPPFAAMFKIAPPMCRSSVRRLHVGKLVNRNTQGWGGPLLTANRRFRVSCSSPYPATLTSGGTRPCSTRRHSPEMRMAASMSNTMWARWRYWAARISSDRRSSPLSGNPRRRRSPMAHHPRTRPSGRRHHHRRQFPPDQAGQGELRPEQAQRPGPERHRPPRRRFHRRNPERGEVRRR